MRRFTISALVAATVAVAAPAAASAATPAGSVGTAIPAPHVITSRIDGVPMTETYDGGGGLPYLGAASSYNAGDWENALRTYVSSGNYQTQLQKVDSVADRWITRGTSHRHGHAASRGHGHKYAKGHAKRAIVLDIDETSLSNYTAIDKDNFTYGTNSRNEATDEVGKAILPTLQVYKDALARGISVFFVTGRPEAQRAPTEDNLEREGYSTWTKLYLKPAGTTLTTVQYKTGARKDIESQGYRIIANIGDQYSDLAGGHAQRAFKLANPFYFLP